MTKKPTKFAVPMGVSLSREIYNRLLKYHRRIEDFRLKTEGRKTQSLSQTMETLLRIGLEAASELDLKRVVKSSKSGGTPKKVKKIGKQMRRRVLGELSDDEVNQLLGRARR